MSNYHNLKTLLCHFRRQNTSLICHVTLQTRGLSFHDVNRNFKGQSKKNLETLLSIKKKLKELASGLKSAPTPPLYYFCLSMRDMPRLVCKTAYIDKNLL